METVKHIVKILDTTALSVLGAASAPAIKDLVDGRPISADLTTWFIIAGIVCVALEILAILLLYTFIDAPNQTNGG